MQVCGTLSLAFVTERITWKKRGDGVAESDHRGAEQHLRVAGHALERSACIAKRRDACGQLSDLYAVCRLFLSALSVGWNQFVVWHDDGGLVGCRPCAVAIQHLPPRGHPFFALYAFGCSRTDRLLDPVVSGDAALDTVDRHRIGTIFHLSVQPEPSKRQECWLLADRVVVGKRHLRHDE